MAVRKDGRGRDRAARHLATSGMETEAMRAARIATATRVIAGAVIAAAAGMAGTYGCDFPIDFSKPMPAGQMVEVGPWVEVGAGSFQMGSPAGEPGRLEDEVLHAVALWNSFQIMSNEVTREQFLSLMDYDPSSGAEEPCMDCPVDSVSWHEAAAFANRLSEFRGEERCYDCSGSGSGVRCEMSPDFGSPYECTGYRLPTEAEFEFAARAGSQEGTYNGTVPEFDCAMEGSGVLDPIAWYCWNSAEMTHAVGGKDPNGWGIKDMLGNVWEWTHDWYAPYEGDAVNPWGPADDTGERTMKGGSREDSYVGARAAIRGHAAPETVTSILGFRLARTI